MRTRNHTKRLSPAAGEETKKAASCSKSVVDDHGTLADISDEAVGKLLRRVNLRGSRRLKKQDGFIRKCDSLHTIKSGTREDEIRSTPSPAKGESGSSKHDSPCDDDDDDDDVKDEMEWEEGSLPTPSSTMGCREENVGSFTVEFEASPELGKRKAVCRVSAEDKELAELVHKVHLLCLLGRGRLIDHACNDPLIQAALLSLVPTQFSKIAEVPKLTATALVPLVNWFHKNFRVTSSSDTERSFQSGLALALEKREGTAEEVAALSVVLFRALNLTTRYVDVVLDKLYSRKLEVYNFSLSWLQ